MLCAANPRLPPSAAPSACFSLQKPMWPASYWCASQRVPGNEQCFANSGVVQCAPLRVSASLCAARLVFSWPIRTRSMVSTRNTVLAFFGDRICVCSCTPASVLLGVLLGFRLCSCCSGATNRGSASPTTVLSTRSPVGRACVRATILLRHHHLCFSAPPFQFNKRDF